MSGSGLFSVNKNVSHAMHGVGGETREIEEALKPMAAITVEEFTNVPASSAVSLLAATACLGAGLVQSFKAADLLAAGLTNLAKQARNITFTTSGVTPANAPASAVIVGTDANGLPQTETVTLAQTATIATGVKAFKTVSSITYAASDGTAASISIGYGDVLGLAHTPLSRAGLVTPIKEIAIGAVVTTGTLSATNKTYTPAASPNDTNDYAVFYEYDPTKG